MKKLLPIIIGLSFSSFAGLSQAENLLQVYQQAKSTNPDLRSAEAERNSAFEKINESRSPLLPQLGLGGDYAFNSGYRDSSGLRSHSLNGSLQLSQTLFDMSKWRTLNLQEKTAGIQDIVYQDAQQTLIINTATAYFNVLDAIDTLSFVEAQKQSIYRQLDQTTQRFNVGLVAITDVQNARSQYDTVLAQEVTARNNLDNMMEALRQVTGNDYRTLSSIDIDRFTTEKPDAITNLLKKAENHNLSLLSARLSKDLAQEQIKYAETGYMPTLSLTASTGLTKNRYQGDRANLSPSTSDAISGSNQVGVNLSIPLYNGGVTHSQVKQAEYSLVSASEKMESAHRATVQTVRSSFNNINASISSINAYRQAVVSAQSSLDAMEAGYKVGTRTIVDVLDATTTLYNARQKLADARYSYLINQLQIKYALGTLNEQDLQRLNGTLGKIVPTAADAIAPENQQQQAIADGQQHETKSTGRANPFHH